MKFLIDMNLRPHWVEYLMEAGFEAVHWSNLGAIKASDTEILARSRRRRVYEPYGRQRHSDKVSRQT
ncbi:MAG: DUF5615 family PIN-like protein [Deltaproteobacteria bacterium]|nr:DUF5615 family PIN-like protein [Deltaproteobacteria bacterium]